MADGAPPSRIRSRHLDPVFAELATGTTAWRVHHRAWDDVFNPHPHVEPFGGGRFDSNQSYRYPFSYLALDSQTALSERLLRDLPYGDTGGRVLPRSTVNGRRLRAVRTTRPITLLDLRTGPALSAVCADEWLIHCGPAEYPKTRAWGHWLREQVPAAEGFIWPSKRNVGGTVTILFGDMCRGAVGWDGTRPGLDLDDRPGAAELDDRLRPYRVTVRPPRA